MEKCSRGWRALWADPLCSEFVESEEFYSKVSAPQELIVELTLSNKRVTVEIRIQLCLCAECSEMEWKASQNTSWRMRGSIWVMGTWAGRDNSEGQSSVKPLEATGGWRRVFTERLINRLTGNKIGWALKVKYCST